MERCAVTASQTPAQRRPAQKFMPTIKSPPILWTCDPSTVPPHNGKKKQLVGPLFDLPALQTLLREGLLDLANDEHFYVANNDCWTDIKKLKWAPAQQIRDALLLLKSGGRSTGQGDYINSQWAKDSDGNWWPSDAYGICINEKEGFARAKNAPETYIKFSIDENGCLCLILLSCHASN